MYVRVKSGGGHCAPFVGRLCILSPLHSSLCVTHTSTWYRVSGYYCCWDMMSYGLLVDVSHTTFVPGTWTRVWVSGLRILVPGHGCTYLDCYFLPISQSYEQPCFVTLAWRFVVACMTCARVDLCARLVSLRLSFLADRGKRRF